MKLNKKFKFILTSLLAPTFLIPIACKTTNLDIDKNDKKEDDNKFVDENNTNKNDKPVDANNTNKNDKPVEENTTDKNEQNIDNANDNKNELLNEEIKENIIKAFNFKRDNFVQINQNNIKVGNFNNLRIDNFEIINSNNETGILEFKISGQYKNQLFDNLLVEYNQVKFDNISKLRSIYFEKNDALLFEDKMTVSALTNLSMTEFLKYAKTFNMSSTDAMQNYSLNLKEYLDKPEFEISNYELKYINDNFIIKFNLALNANEYNNGQLIKKSYNLANIYNHNLGNILFDENSYASYVLNHKIQLKNNIDSLIAAKYASSFSAEAKLFENIGTETFYEINNEYQRYNDPARRINLDLHLKNKNASANDFEGKLYINLSIGNRDESEHLIASETSQKIINNFKIIDTNNELLSNSMLNMTLNTNRD
ncbi:UNVERIFIED_CONTAM: hypothetical protein O8I53_13255 [Campylobacter lari]